MTTPSIADLATLGQTGGVEIPDVDWFAIAPELSLFGAALLIVLGRSLLRHDPRVRALALAISFVGIALAAVFTAIQWRIVGDDGPYQAIAGMVAVDGFSVFVRVVVLVSLLLTVLVSMGYLGRERLEGPEYLALLLLSATGMGVMASANDLIVVFLALEVLSIALYVLVAFDRRRLTSQEAGLKYFVLGAFSSAVLLYGIALVYGATGTTSLPGIASFLATTSLFDSGVLLAGIALLLAGFGFKVAAAPFHMWTPDVYQGAPTPITGFMAAATKVAAFAAVLRVLVGSFDAYAADWRPAVWVLAVLSLVVGSVAAVVQTDVKRMLAYSSIAHAGFVLIGVQVVTDRGTAAALLYLFVYAFMAIGAFAVVTAVAHGGDEDHALERYRGLARNEPVLAGLLTLCLLAQAGVPLTGGFVAKLGVFGAAVDAGQYPLALIGMLAAVVGAFVYLRIVLTMYAPQDEDAEGAAGDGTATADGAVLAPPRVRLDQANAVALALASAAILVTGILPQWLQDFARDATLLLGAG